MLHIRMIVHVTCTHTCDGTCYTYIWLYMLHLHIHVIVHVTHMYDYTCCVYVQLYMLHMCMIVLICMIVCNTYIWLYMLHIHMTVHIHMIVHITHMYDYTCYTYVWLCTYIWLYVLHICVTVHIYLIVHVTHSLFLLDLNMRHCDSWKTVHVNTVSEDNHILFMEMSLGWLTLNLFVFLTMTGEDQNLLPQRVFVCHLVNMPSQEILEQRNRRLVPWRFYLGIK